MPRRIKRDGKHTEYADRVIDMRLARLLESLQRQRGSVEEGKRRDGS